MIHPPQACINNTTIDDGTQGFIYDNSTVNCTALMFGDRWYAFECDEVCRATLGSALPAALVSAVGPELEDSDAVQNTTRAIHVLLGRPVTFLRLSRFSRQLRSPTSPLAGIAREAAEGLAEFFREYVLRLRQETRRMAHNFGLNGEAIERILRRLTEYEDPSERPPMPDPIPHPETETEWEQWPEPDPWEMPTQEEMNDMDLNILESRRRFLNPNWFPDLDEFEYFVRSELELTDVARYLRERRGEGVDPPPTYEEVEELPPDYEPPPEYRPEQRLYDSHWRYFELPPIQEEIVRYMPFVPMPRIPIPSPTIPPLEPTIGPTHVPILSANTLEASEVQLNLDGTFTITGSGA
jgi:hypothetical protein